MLIGQKVDSSFHVNIFFFRVFEGKEAWRTTPKWNTGGPRIARILGPCTIMLLEESCKLGTDLVLKPVKVTHLIFKVSFFT